MRLAQQDLSDFWRSLNVDGSPVAVRDAVLAVLPDLISPYADASALLGADWYDMLRDAPPSAASFRAVLGGELDREQVQASARWALGSLFDGDAGAALSNLSGSTQRFVMQGFRDSVFGSANRDPLPVRYARVPTGPTCKFCVMVASRGFVYRTAATAGESNHWHDNCNCMIVPGVSARDYPEGFNLDELRTLYAQDSGIGIDAPTQ